MPSGLRFACGGRIFDKSMDYAAFERVLKQAKDFVPMRLLAYCVLSNHWHLVVWPFQDGDLSEYLRWLTVTHTQRWHAHYHTAGTGALYQGRFKSFPVQEESTCWPCAATWSVIRSGPTWCPRQKPGVGEAFGTGCMARR